MSAELVGPVPTVTFGGGPHIQGQGYHSPVAYVVEVAGRTVPCSYDTAELAAAHDEKVLSRWATNWVPSK